MRCSHRRSDVVGAVDKPGPFIQTLSGRRVNPLDAAPEDIDPADIACALANLCRFGGHSRGFYSVAQHSVIVCDLLEERGATPDELLAALLHDAAEAYLGDLPHPLKHRSELGAAFRVAEKRLEAVIAARFALTDASARIKPLDRALLATERRIFSLVAWHWPELDGVEPLELTISPWTPSRAQEEFTRRFERISAARDGAAAPAGASGAVCTVVRPGASYEGRQGLSYGAGISAESAGSRALCLHRLSRPPGARAVAHLHEAHETAIHVISGRGEFWWGPRLEHHEVVEAGDYVHIPAGVPHLPVNRGDVPLEAVIARTDPNEQESVVVLDELDALPHLPRQSASVANVSQRRGSPES